MVSSFDFSYFRSESRVCFGEFVPVDFWRIQSGSDHLGNAFRSHCNVSRRRVAKDVTQFRDSGGRLWKTSITGHQSMWASSVAEHTGYSGYADTDDHTIRLIAGSQRNMTKFSRMINAAMQQLFDARFLELSKDHSGWSFGG